MSSPKYRWWGYARRMIRDYPSLKQQHQDLHEQSMTAGYSGTGGGGGAGRKTEQVALRELPPDDQDAYDAVRQAVEATLLIDQGKNKLALIEQMYWLPKPLPIGAAAYKLHISEPTAKRWHRAFVRLVGKCYGFTIDTPEPK